MKRIFLLLLFVILLTGVCFSQDATTDQSLSANAVPDLNTPIDVPPIIAKVDAIEKEFNWVSTTTMNIVISAILLCPEPFRDNAISRFRAILNRELTTRNVPFVSRDMAIKAVEEIVPPEHLDSIKELLGITQKGRKYVNPRVNAGMRIPMKKAPLEVNTVNPVNTNN